MREIVARCHEGKHDAVGFIRRRELAVAPEAAGDDRVAAVLLSVGGAQQRESALEVVCREASQRTDIVEHKNAAAVCADYQIVLPLLEGEIHHGRGWQPGGIAGPVLAGIQAKEQTELGAGPEQIAILGVLQHR